MIVTAVDSVSHYQDCMRAFLMSLALNAPEEKVYVHLMNCSREYGASLVRINANVVISHEHTEEQNAYVRNYVRHRLLYELSEQYDTLAWIDNDSLVRVPLDGLLGDVEPDTVKFWYRRKKRKPYQFQAGVYAIGAGALVREWLRAVIRGLSKRSDWLAPQEIMIDELNRLSIAKIPLASTYNDSKFHKDSFIWHCKSSHFEDPRYQEEYQYYLEAACEKLKRSFCGRQCRMYPIEG